MSRMLRPTFSRLASRERFARSRRRGRGARQGRIERLEDRTLLRAALAAPEPLDLPGAAVEEIGAPREVDVFQVTLSEPGRLTVRTQTSSGSPLDTRTTLRRPDGQLLIQSDADSTGNRNDFIVQHLLAGAYYVEVEGRNDATGRYTLSAGFQSATPPHDPLEVNYAETAPFSLQPWIHTAGDFNGDGHLDLATGNTYTDDLSVLLGVGDGSFQPPVNYKTGVGPIPIVAADFNRDGRLDLATANVFSNDISVLLGRGDGAFDDELRTPGGTYGSGLAAADFNGDGRLDLILTNLKTNDVSVLLGHGDGAFDAERRFAAGDDPWGASVADFNDDGRLDVAVTNFNSNDLSVLLGRGDGTFHDQLRFPVGEGPTNRVSVGDFNGDSRIDLAVVNSGSADISVLSGQENGSFGDERRYGAGASPFATTSGDFNGDGLLDLIAANRQSNDVSILPGRADGTFGDQQRFPVGLQPLYVGVGDFNGDGLLDVSAANARSHDISILLGLGDGTFHEDPSGFREGETNPQGMVARDFNRDGVLDLATVTYTGGDVFVFLGRGDGTFHNRVRYPVGSTPVEIVAEDFNGDGFFDLATANCDSSDTSVLLGRGDGTFEEQRRYQASSSGEFIVSADLNNDGHPDLVTGGQYAFGAAVILGRGDGTFQEEILFAETELPADAVAADFNGDGRIDLATTNIFSPDHDISLYRGRGDGTFDDPLHFPVGDGPLGLVSGDFNGDGLPDLANANSKADSVSVLLGRADGTFESELRFGAGPGPDFLLTRDVNGDGRLDLAVSNSGSNDVSILLGRGDGTFLPEQRFTTSETPTPRRGLEAADFDRDGQSDLAVSQVLGNDVAVLLGAGDGQFRPPRRFVVGLGPAALVTGDFSGDGRLDVASVNPTTNEVSLALGAGDATLQRPVRFAVGAGPVSVAAEDFNRDGRLDLATANFGSSDVSILLGLGNGAFRQELRAPAGANPVGLAAGDFDGDNRPDLAVVNAGSSSVWLLLGQGDGAFQNSLQLSVEGLPQAVAAGDLDRDGWLDLVTANHKSGDAAVFLGRGDGAFHSPRRFAAGVEPAALQLGDWNGDGELDLAVANAGSGDVAVLLGRGEGTFREAVAYEVGIGPVSLTVSDFNGDGRPDLGAANGLSDDLTILLGEGDGTFAAPWRRPLADYPSAAVAGDFDGDARPDLAVATQLAVEVSLWQGLGDATFAPGGAISNPRRSTPRVLDWNQDRVADVAVLGQEGKIVLRLGRPDAVGMFEAPIVLNPDPRFAVRDLAIVSSPHGPVLAALDAKSARVSLYRRLASGQATRIPGPRIPGALPAILQAGDLSGDGRDDLVVSAAGSNQILVYLDSTTGGPLAFSQTPDYALSVGVSPSAIELADVDGDRRLDIVVANQFAGDVSVLANDALQPFARELRFRAGTGLFGLVEHGGGLAVRSPLRPSNLVVEDFDEDLLLDLAIANGAANRVSLLPGNGAGGFSNPAADLTFATDNRPTVVVAGRFNGDTHFDLAVLNEGSGNLSILLGDGRGGFVEKLSRDHAGREARPSAGNAPSGLSLHDVNGDGRQDLLVGNEFGDLLTLLGNGDGAFQPYQRVGQNIALAAADLNGDGRDDFIFANQARDRLTVQYSQPGQSLAREREDGLLAPGAVASADLNRDGHLDLVVANSGANNVLVYLGAGQGQFGFPLDFFVGTNPIGVTIQDLNGDRLPDLVVANEGSNDVAVLLGQGEAETWTLTGGPRLRVGAGPTSTAVQDLTEDGVPDLLVSNSQSNNVFLLPGVGRGFFDDRNPIIRDVGQDPAAVLANGSGVFTINRGSNNVTFLPDFLSPLRFDISSGGLRPVAAVAGDFNSDGRGDLIVANHGDGVVTLLLGDADRLISAQSFSRDDVPRPTALTTSRLAGGMGVYVVNEGQESAILLTSFGIPVPFLSDQDRRGPLTNVFLATGPGFAAARSIFTTGRDGDDPDARQTDLDSLSPPALFYFIATRRIAALRPTSPTEEQDDQADGEEPEAASRALLDFFLGVDEGLLRSLSTPADAKSPPAAADRVFGALERGVRDWLPILLREIETKDGWRIFDTTQAAIVGRHLLLIRRLGEGLHDAVDAFFGVLDAWLRNRPAAAEQDGAGATVDRPSSAPAPPSFLLSWETSPRLATSARSGCMVLLISGALQYAWARRSRVRAAGGSGPLHFGPCEFDG